MSPDFSRPEQCPNGYRIRIIPPDSDDAGTQTHTRITAVVFGEKTTRAKLPRALRPPRRPHARIARPRPHAAQADAVAKLWPGLPDSFADGENK